MECIPEHLAADEPEDNERDDARIGFDEGPHQRTSIEPDHGHEPLKDTEEDGHQETVGFIGSAIDEGVGHRYRKSVHGKGKSQNEKFDRAHGLVLPQFSMHDLFMTAQINRSSESIDFGCHMYRFIDIIYEQLIDSSVSVMDQPASLFLAATMDRVWYEPPLARVEQGMQ